MQQPKQSNRNLILFAVMSFTIMMGYMAVKNWLFPPPPPPELPAVVTPPPKLNPKLATPVNVFASSAGATEPGTGLGGAALLAFDAGKLSDAFKPTPLSKSMLARIKPFETLRNVCTGIVTGSEPGTGPIALVPDLVRLAVEYKHRMPAPAVAKTRPTPPPIILGSADKTSDFFMRARLTALGAAVRQIILNRFEKADILGRPVRGEPLELVGEDLNRVIGSNLLYPVANPSDSQERPINTLGETLVWDTVTAPAAGKVVSWDKANGKLELDIEGVNYPFHMTAGNAPMPEAAEGSSLQEKLGALKEGEEAVLVYASDGDRLVVRDVSPADNDPLLRTASFSAPFQQVIYTKTFTLDPQTYHLRLKIKIEAAPTVSPGQEAKARYHLTSAHGLPIEGAWFTATFRNALIGLVDANDYCSRAFQDVRTIRTMGGGDEVLRKGSPSDPERKQIQFGGIGVQYFTSQVVVAADDLAKMFIERARPTVVSSVVHGTVKSASVALKVIEVTGNDKIDYKLHVLDDTLLNKVGAMIAMGSPVGVPVSATWRWAADDRRIVTDLYLGPDATRQLLPEPAFTDVNVHMISDVVTVKPGEPKEHEYLLYNGPLKVRLLAQLAGDQAVPNELVELYHDKLHLSTLTDAPWTGWEWFTRSTGLTWLLLGTTNLMHFVLWALHTYVFPWSWAVCIILLTLMVRALMHPITRRATLNSMKMQALQPELKKLKEKYKDDQQALGLAQMELYRKNKVSLTGSCWTMFLQMPIFMGLYWCLQESIHFRLAPFWPGMQLPWIFSDWLQNLAAPDMMLPWEWLPVIADPSTATGFFGFLYLGPFFNLLPVLAAGLMMVVQRMMMPPATTEQEETQRAMMKYMPIIMAVLFFKVAAGLCLYFIVSSIWGLVERKLLLPKKHPDLPNTAAPPVEEKKDDTKPSIWGMALERLNEATKSRETPIAAAPTPAPAAEPPPVGGGKKNRKQRKKDKNKKAKPGGSPPPPTANGADSRGLVDKVRDWIKDVLKNAEKK